MKKRLRKIIIATIIFLLAVFIEKINFVNIDKNMIFIIQIVLYVLSYLIVGFEVLKKAVINIFHGEFFDENFLMSIATIGAFAIKEFPEAVAVMLFYQIGEYFQSYAVKKSRKSIASLMDIRPDYANIIREFMEENRINNPIIIAHSFGGRIATLLTGYYKERIDKIILIDAASIKPKKKIRQKIKEKLYKFLKRLIKIFPPVQRETYHQKLIQYFGSADYQALPVQMRETFKNIVNENLIYYLKYIESETLILWGKLDQDTPIKDGIKMNRLIKNSALIVFPKGTHFSYLEYPSLTNQIIQEFLKEKAVEE